MQDEKCLSRSDVKSVYFHLHFPSFSFSSVNLGYKSIQLYFVHAKRIKTPTIFFQRDYKLIHCFKSAKAIPKMLVD